MTMHILLIDDRPQHNCAMYNSLVEMGYTVTISRTVGNALTYLKSKPTNTVKALLWYLSPVPPPAELIKQTENIHQQAHSPFIVVGQGMGHQHIRAALAGGAALVMSEPYHTLTLQRLITHILVDNDYYTLHAAFRRTAAPTGIRRARFDLKSPEEARFLANLFAMCYPDPAKAALGLHELMMNAVEHGLLGFNFEAKNRLLTKGTWAETLYNAVGEHTDPQTYATAELEITPEGISTLITDPGKGFDWEPYTTFDPARLTSPNGRGIATACQYSFDSITFTDGGRTVTAFTAFKPTTAENDENQQLIGNSWPILRPYTL